MPGDLFTCRVHTTKNLANFNNTGVVCSTRIRTVLNRPAIGVGKHATGESRTGKSRFPWVRLSNRRMKNKRNNGKLCMDHKKRRISVYAVCKAVAWVHMGVNILNMLKTETSCVLRPRRTAGTQERKLPQEMNVVSFVCALVTGTNQKLQLLLRKVSRFLVFGLLKKFKFMYSCISIICNWVVPGYTLYSVVTLFLLVYQPKLPFMDLNVVVKFSQFNKVIRSHKTNNINYKTQRDNET